MAKVDLHTHSTASPDGGIKPEQYRAALETELLDCIAVTDHNTIEVAQNLCESLGERIIVGEEVMTSEGELVGLFLKELVKPDRSAKTTAEAIKAQGGLVYVPHPFETVRKGISEADLDKIANLVDIIEVHNGRALLQNRGTQAINWAKDHGKAMAASSDAHGYTGLGTSYTQLTELPTVKTALKLLAKARYGIDRPPLQTLLHPKMNRLRRKLGGS